MRRILFILVVFALGLGMGFYLWGFDNVDFMSAEMKKVVERAPTQLVQKEDVVAKPLTAADITSRIVGKWQSVDDSKFTRTFSVDASVTDTYEGDAAGTTEGRWAVFTAPQGEPPPFPIAKGTIYLKISNPEEVLYFKVTQVAENRLELIYLDGNGGQQFERRN